VVPFASPEIEHVIAPDVVHDPASVEPPADV
jgi:hypothetical protein